MESKSIFISSHNSAYFFYTILSMIATRLLALQIFNQTRFSSLPKRMRKKEKKIYWPRKMHGNAQRWRAQCIIGKCIRYPVSREFTASGYTVVFYRVGRRAKLLRGISFLPNWDSISPGRWSPTIASVYSSVYYSRRDSTTCNPIILKYRLLHERSRADISRGEVY